MKFISGQFIVSHTNSVYTGVIQGGKKRLMQSGKKEAGTRREHNE